MGLTDRWRMRESASASSSAALVRGGDSNSGGDADVNQTGCGDCDGTGTTAGGDVCASCDGTGWVDSMSESDSPDDKSSAPGPDEKTCPTCNGKGKIRGGAVDCPDCDGSGKVSKDSMKESAIERDFAALAGTTVIDVFGDGSLRESSVERMSEKDFSSDDRKALAAKGQAIPVRNDAGEITGGSYPIETADDVDAAIKAYGRNPTPTVKAHIIKMAQKVGTKAQVDQAKSLGSSDSVKEAAAAPEILARLEALESQAPRLRQLESMREAKPGQMTSTYSQPTRVKTSGGEEGYGVILIREGMGNSEDARWYTGQAIQEMCESGYAEGMQAYADHPDMEEEELRPERSVKHLVGHYRDVTFKEADKNGPARAEAVFVPLTLNEAHPTYGWVVTLAEAASKSTGPQPLCGISLYGAAAGDYGERPDGSTGSIATMIRPQSGDIVTNAGAGGGFLRRLMESARAARKTTSKESSDMTPEQAKIAFDSAAALREAGKTEQADKLEASIPTDQLTPLREAAKASAPAPSASESAELARLRAENQSLRESGQKDKELLGRFTGMMDITAALREAEPEMNDTDIRHFVSMAESRRLTDKGDIKAMVEAERSREQDLFDRVLSKVRESQPEFDIEGIIPGWAPPKDENGESGSQAAATDALREAGVPMKKLPDPAAA